jgi:hypothetical protein
MNKNTLDIIKFENEIFKPDFPINKKGWVNYGKKNGLDLKLIELKNQSALHNSIIKSKIEQTLGLGFNNQEIPIIKFLNKYILKKITSDLIIYGGFYIEVLKKKNNEFTFNHIDYSNIRVDAELEDNKPTTAYYSSDWSLANKSGFEIEEEYKIYYDLTDVNSKELPSKFIYSYLDYNSTYNYYAIADYIAAINAIECDALINQYFNDNLKNGMVGGIIFNYPSYPEDDEKRLIKDKIVEQYTGVNNANKVIVNFADGKENLPEIIPIQNNTNDDKFTNLLNTTYQTILSAHRITNPLLVGIKTEGQLGGNQELINSQMLYYNTVIKNYQSIILEAIINILSLNKTEYKDLEIINNQPIQFQYSENIMKEILTKDEMREVIGYEPLDKRKRRSKSLAEVIGGIGIQNVINIITNQNMNDNQKINMLVIAYDIEIEDAELLVLNKNLKVMDNIENLKNNL